MIPIGRRSQAEPVPMGEPLGSSEEELDAAAIITPEDIRRAMEWAERYAADTDLPALLRSETETE